MFIVSPETACCRRNKTLAAHASAGGSSVCKPLGSGGVGCAGGDNSQYRINCHPVRRWMRSGPDDFAKTPAGTWNVAAGSRLP
jgi:hypothetical protein